MFEVRKNKNGKYYFVLKANNGQVIVKSFAYATLTAAYNGIKVVQKYAVKADIKDEIVEL